jgi:DNA-binding response OmpR family regulator
MTFPIATVLVIDDDEDIVESLKVLLQTSGYAAIAATSVREALDLLDEHSDIGLVISDIRMPDVDGLDLVRVLRHRFPTLPTILVSGMPLTDEDVIPREATLILSKPVSPAELEQAIATMLRPRP